MTDTLTIKEAVELKGVAPSTIHRAVKERRLPATAWTPPGSVKGEWRISRADLESWTPAIDMAERGRRSAAARKRKGNHK